MPIFCDAVPQASELAQVIGGDVRAAESLEAASRSLAGDPAETLVVIGPDTGTDEALAFSASAAPGAARRRRGAHPGPGRRLRC